MTEQIFEVEIECRSCDATGLYSGMCEWDKCGVVCTTCKGTGKELFKIKYTPFKDRKRRNDIKRVFKDTCGFFHSDTDKTKVDGGIIPFSKGGVEYDQWTMGAEPKPVKELYCPYLWTGQRMKMNDQPQHAMYKTRCKKHLSLGSTILECTLFGEKRECWEIYESMGGK